MVIHLATAKDVPLLGYESDTAPRVGENIKLPRNGNEYVVLKVTHMLKEPIHGLGQDLKLEIVHCIVRKGFSYDDRD